MIRQTEWISVARWRQTRLLLPLLFVPLMAIVSQGEVTFAQADSPQSLMARANQHYEAERYEEALLEYEELVERDISNGALLFNLGNTYFKSGEIGHAILNYERAARLMPRDRDLRANLALAQNAIADRFESQRDSILGQLAEISSRWITSGELEIIALLAWMTVTLLWFIHRRLSEREQLRHEATWISLLAAFTLLVLIVGIWGIRAYTESTRGQAIVLAQEVDVLSGPGEQHITEFTLHSGSKVSVLESRGEWHRLALPGDELQGWVPQNSLGLIKQK